MRREAFASLATETSRREEISEILGVPYDPAAWNDWRWQMRHRFTRIDQFEIKLRVRLYYLYQCDPVLGTGHLRTTVEKGLELMAQLRGHITGYAMPTYVIDAPGGGGKVPVQRETITGVEDGVWTLRNWAGQAYQYVDPTERMAHGDRI